MNIAFNPTPTAFSPGSGIGGEFNGGNYIYIAQLTNWVADPINNKLTICTYVNVSNLNNVGLINLAPKLDQTNFRSKICSPEFFYQLKIDLVFKRAVCIENYRLNLFILFVLVIIYLGKMIRTWGPFISVSQKGDGEIQKLGLNIV